MTWDEAVYTFKRHHATIAGDALWKPDADDIEAMARYDAAGRILSTYHARSLVRPENRAGIDAEFVAAVGQWTGVTSGLVGVNIL